MNTTPISLNKDMMNKVPAITLIFWLIKIMATTIGETGADFLIFNVHLGLTLTSIIMGTLLLICLFIQIQSKQYIPILYWVSVVMISIVGTLITDNLTDQFGVALTHSTILFSIALAFTFAIWYKQERTLSIHTIYTIKREIFYWLAILFTFALGTAAGDLMAESLKFGYVLSGLIFLGMIAVTAIAHFKFKLNEILSFWIAYILTRPLGASFGDYLSQPLENGGLGLGTINTSLTFLMIIIGLVLFISIKNNKTNANQI